MRLSKIGESGEGGAAVRSLQYPGADGPGGEPDSAVDRHGEAMYPVDENVRLTEQGAAALMEMEGRRPGGWPGAAWATGASWRRC